MYNVSYGPFFSLFACTYAYLTIPYHSSHIDFKNPNDPHDRSFDPHPTNYPVGELEFPNSGASERYVFHFFFFLFGPRASMASGNFLEISSIACSVKILHTSLCNACVVLPTTLKHDQACIPNGRLISRAHPFPPRFCPGSIARLLATSPIQCSTLTRRAFHSPFLGYHPCSSLLLRVLSPLTSLPGPCRRTCASTFRYHAASTCEGWLPASILFCIYYQFRATALFLYFAFDHHRFMTNSQGSWSSRFLSFCPISGLPLRYLFRRKLSYSLVISPLRAHSFLWLCTLVSHTPFARQTPWTHLFICIIPC